MARPKRSRDERTGEIRGQLDCGNGGEGTGSDDDDGGWGSPADDDDGGSGDRCCFDTVDGILTVNAEEISLVVVGIDECGNEGLCEIDLCGPEAASMAFAPRDRGACAADLDGNGLVDADDLMLLFAAADARSGPSRPISMATASSTMPTSWCCSRTGAGADGN